MNQPVSDVKLTVEGKEEQVTEIVVGSLLSSVDKNTIGITPDATIG